MTNNSSLYCVVAPAYDGDVLYYRPAYGEVKGFIVYTVGQVIGHNNMMRNVKRLAGNFGCARCLGDILE